MKTNPTLFGLPLMQAIGFLSFIVTIASVWVHMEIRIAEINVQITGLKEDLQFHKTDNRKDFEVLQGNARSDTREILSRIDEIQIYLRNKK